MSIEAEKFADEAAERWARRAERPVQERGNCLMGPLDFGDRTCDECEGSFDLTEWANRHSPHAPSCDGTSCTCGSVHDTCCPGCDP